jgi:hypothetical protein
MANTVVLPARAPATPSNSTATVDTMNVRVSSEDVKKFRVQASACLTAKKRNLKVVL